MAFELHRTMQQIEANVIARGAAVDRTKNYSLADSVAALKKFRHQV